MVISEFKFTLLLLSSVTLFITLVLIGTSFPVFVIPVAFSLYNKFTVPAKTGAADKLPLVFSIVVPLAIVILFVALFIVPDKSCKVVLMVLELERVTPALLLKITFFTKVPDVGHAAKLPAFAGLPVEPVMVF